MRKKYLSALLFGALLVTSAGTFTSCKDYDDDINNLQEQITANADAIKALEQLVKAGKYVSGVAMEGQVITFTFSDGTTQTVTIPEGEKGQVVEVKDNELYIDGEATGIKVAEDAAVEAGLVKAENGTWWVLGEDGEYTNTNIPVSGVTVSGSEKDGYTFTIYNEKGEAQTVKLPTAASAISSIIIAEGSNTLYVYNNEDGFEFKGNNIISKASDWKGTKKLPEDGSYIISTSDIDVRINPVAADVSNVDFYLTNTKNKDVPSVVLTAEAESDDDPLTGNDIKGRAANTGNGLWTLSMANTAISKDAFENANTGLSGLLNASADNGNVVYALNAAHACRSLYEVQLLDKDYTIFDAINFTQGSGNSQPIDPVNESPKVKVGSPVKVGVYLTTNLQQDVTNSLYDMYLEADDSDVEVYGLTFDQANHTFTVGKNPDVSTVDANFTLNVYTVDVTGNVKKEVVTVNIATDLIAATEYETISHNVAVSEAKKNYFGIDLSTMKTALGDNLNAWMQNVDLTETNIEYKWSTDKNNINGDIPDGFELDIVEKLVDIPDGDITKVQEKATSDRNKANFIQVSIDNSKDYTKLNLDKEYYIKVTFKQKGNTDNVLNSIVVPVKFTAPAFADLFEKESAVFVNNGNVAHAYLNVADYATYAQKEVYAFKNAFKEIPTHVNYSIPDEAFSNDYKYTDLAGIENKTGLDGVNIDAIYLKDKDVNSVSGIPAGYKKEIKVVAKADADANENYLYEDSRWIYAEGKESYTFNVMIMSPIYEGVVTATDNVVTIPATGSAYYMSNDDIKGTTYNNIAYKVLPDLVATEGEGEEEHYIAEWSRQEIKAVTAKSNNERVFKVAETPSPAYYTTDGAGNLIKLEGTLAVTPQNIAETTESTMTVTVEDVWGYKKPNDIKVKITVGE